MSRREISIKVVNDTPFPLALAYASTQHGAWTDDVAPPAVIPAHGEGSWKLESRGLSMYGIEETSSYVVVDNGRTADLAGSVPARLHDAVWLKYVNPLNGPTTLESHMYAGGVPESGDIPLMGSPGTIGAPPGPGAPSDFLDLREPIYNADDIRAEEAWRDAAGHAVGFGLYGAAEMFSKWFFQGEPHALMAVHIVPRVPMYVGGRRVTFADLPAVPPPPPSWQLIQGATPVLRSMAVDARGLVAIDLSDRVLRRGAEIAEEAWTVDADGPPNGSLLAAWGGTTYLIGGDRRLRMGTGAGDWTELGDADAFEVPTAGIFTAPPEELSDLAANPAAGARAGMSGTAAGPAAIHGVQEAATAPYISAGALRTTPSPASGAAPRTAPDQDTLATARRVETLTATEDSLFATSTAGDLWKRDRSRAGAPWVRVDWAPVCSALAYIGRKLYALSDDALLVRPAQSGRLAWAQLGFPGLPSGARTLAAATVSATLGRLFIATRDGELWTLELPPTLA
jgi:hypothetical protein